MPQTLKLCSWNVNGIRAVAKKGFHNWLWDNGFDIVCLQETKAQPEQLESNLTQILGYPFIEFNSAERKGYSGVANLIKEDIIPESFNFGFDYERFNSTPIKISRINAGKSETTIEFDGSINRTELKKQIIDFNSEGRIIESHHKYQELSFILFNIYFPNGGANTERLKFKLEFYEAFLLYLKETLKINSNIIITGDYNTAHHEIDLARPKENTNTSGFMEIERIYLDKLEALGFKDSFRVMHPNETDRYTWWSFRTAARKRNVGWRIDYFFISDALIPNLKEATIHSEVEGSDHCPISIKLDL